MWTSESIHEVVLAQREFFKSGVTLPIKWRIEQLKKLKNAIISHQKLMEDALKKI